MVLAPLLSALTDLEETQIFPCSIVILFPICILSLVFAEGWADFSFLLAIPYLLGSLLGGIGAGIVMPGWIALFLPRNRVAVKAAGK